MRRFAALSTALLLIPGVCHAWTATIISPLPTQESMPGLTLDQALNLPITVDAAATDPAALVTLSGKFDLKDASLIRDSDILVKGDASERFFKYRIRLKTEISQITLIGVSPYGNVESFTIRIKINDWVKFAEQFNFYRADKNFIYLSAGLSSSNYSETGMPSHHEFGTTVKLAYRRLIFGPRFDLAANAFYTLLPLSSNIPNVTVRYLGANFRLGYVVPWVKAPWSFSLMTGFYYTTMFVSNDLFGYSNLFYPQLFPVLRRQMNNGTGWTLYLKYVPINKSFFVPSFSERELAAGISWDKPLKVRHPLSLSIDVSDLTFNSAPGYNLHTSSVSLGVGYGL